MGFPPPLGWPSPPRCAAAGLRITDCVALAIIIQYERVFLATNKCNCNISVSGSGWPGVHLVAAAGQCRARPSGWLWSDAGVMSWPPGHRTVMDARLGAGRHCLPALGSATTRVDPILADFLAVIRPEAVERRLAVPLGRLDHYFQELSLVN